MIDTGLSLLHGVDESALISPAEGGRERRREGGEQREERCESVCVCACVCVCVCANLFKAR